MNYLNYHNNQGKLHTASICLQGSQTFNPIKILPLVMYLLHTMDTYKEIAVNDVLATPLVKFIQNYIRDLSGVFSIFSLVYILRYPH